MSKTFEDNALKVKSIAEGCLNHFNEVAQYGFKEDNLKKIAEDAEKAIEMSKEVDRLRVEVGQKLQVANAALADVKDRAASYRRTIKNNFAQEKWARFGIGDKR